MNTQGALSSTGELGLTVTRRRDLGNLRRRPSKLWQIKNWINYRRREIPATVIYRLFGRLFSLVTIESELRVKVFHIDGTFTDYGVVSRRKVTTAGVAYLGDCFRGTSEPENFKYHGFGTGTNAEANTDTVLQTELTTQYVGDTRVTGSQVGSGAVYTSVATLSPDSGGTIAVTEHGIFSAAASGTLWDRSVFSAVNLVAGSDSLQATYSLTIAPEA